MAIIKCQECGKEISSTAKACPSCGAGQKKSNGLMTALIIVLIAGVGIFSYFQFFRASGDSDARIAAAKDLLSSNCGELTNMSTEYIKKKWAADLVQIAEGNRCDCVIEILAPKMADKYSLQELLDLKNKPIHDIQDITELIEANKSDVMKCLTFQK